MKVYPLEDEAEERQDEGVVFSFKVQIGISARQILGFPGVRRVGAIGMGVPVMIMVAPGVGA